MPDVDNPQSYEGMDEPSFAKGGRISGPGYDPTDDRIPAILSDGCIYMDPKARARYGDSLLNDLNAVQDIAFGQNHKRQWTDEELEASKQRAIDDSRSTDEALDRVKYTHNATGNECSIDDIINGTCEHNSFPEDPDTGGSLI